MKLTKKTSRLATGVASGLFGAALLAVPAQASTFFVPGLIIGVLTDDNVFISADDRENDIITRLSPSLAAGFESERLLLGASYTQDIEWYRNNPELDRSDMRQYATADLLYRLNQFVLLSVDASHTQSRIPSELNISSGAGEGRIDGERTTVNSALSYRLSERSRAQIDYTHSRDNLSGGTDGETNAVNLEYEHALTPSTLMTYGYTYTHFSFDNPLAGVIDQTEAVHTPRVGFIHDLSPYTTLSAQGGPSYASEGDVGANISILLQRRYADGVMSLGYDRSAASLIGEPGLVELNVVNANIAHDFTNRFSVGLSVGHSEVLRDEPVIFDGNALLFDSDIIRASIEAQYRVNDYASIQANFSHSNQRLTTLTGAQRIPRNVAMLTLTLTYPRRSEPVVFVR